MRYKNVKFKKLLNSLANCRSCHQNFGFEPRPIVWGKQNAKIVHISQAPSLSVHKIGRPFSDKSGEKLRNEWYKISSETFYNQNLIYITAVGHCYPGKNKTGDKKPPKICAQKWLKNEVKFLKPKLFLVVGNYAAGFFFPKQKLTDLVFKDLKIKDIPCFILPHPSPLNIKWFKDHPEFEKKRLPIIRDAIKEALKK